MATPASEADQLTATDDGQDDERSAFQLEATPGSVLESLRIELRECRNRVSHYSRLAVELELRLEHVDREQQKAFRRAQELAEEVQTEEGQQNRLEAIEQRHREDEILALVQLQPTKEITPEQLATKLRISLVHVRRVLRKMVVSGRVRLVRRGVYGVPTPT